MFGYRSWGSRKNTFRRSQRRFRSRFEPLEDRRLLTTFNVNTTIDRVIDTSLTTLAHPFGNGGKLTLREAVYLANLDNSAPTDTITLKAKSTYKITVAGAGEDNDFTGDFDIVRNLTIKKTGNGSDPIVNGNGLDRVFDMQNDSNVLTLDHLFITGGIARDAAGGGGVTGTVDETLILTNTTIKGNISTSPGSGLGGGIALDDGSAISMTNSHVDGNSAAAGVIGVGGGIYIHGGSGSVTIKNSTVNSNSAYTQGGGIADLSDGDLIITNSQINNNHSGDGGGGGLVTDSDSVVTVTNSTISGNTTVGEGGGMFMLVSPLITITKSNFSNNSAVDDGGAVWCDDSVMNISCSTFQNNTSSGAGGAISGVQEFTVTDSTFNHNVANGVGGAIDQEDQEDITILRSTFTHNASLGDTGGAINADGGGVNIRVTNSKFTYNSALEQGGAIAGNGDFMFIDGSTFDHNSSTNGDGGAIDDAAITATNSSFTYNTSKADGGAFNSENNDVTLTRCLVSCNTATNGEGGGFIDGGPDRTMTITDCTISGNTAGGNGGGFAAEGVTLTMSGSTVNDNRSGSDGGGAYIITSGTNDNAYPLPLGDGSSIFNCTITNNGAATDGGGIDFEGEGDLTIINCTIVFNASFNGGGIAQTNGGGTIHIGNTIVAKNIAANEPDAYNPASGTFDDLGHNLVFADPDSVFTNSSDIFGLAPLLGALANNGGPTKTHALLKGSPAINAGDDALNPGVDQRGVKRPQGPHVDIGAYEKK